MHRLTILSRSVQKKDRSEGRDNIEETKEDRSKRKKEKDQERRKAIKSEGEEKGKDERRKRGRQKRKEIEKTRAITHVRLEKREIVRCRKGE